MRNHATARPANHGHSTSFAFAIVLMTAIIPSMASSGMFAQDAHAQMPSSYIEDGQDGPASDFGDFAPPAQATDQNSFKKITKTPATETTQIPRKPSAAAPKTAPAHAVSKANPVKPAAQLIPKSAGITPADSPRSKALHSSSSNPIEPLAIASRTEETSDIYGAWAAKKLKNRQKLATSKPHPLALEYPSHFVVVCEAGCRNEVEQIVYLEPKDARGPVFETPKENTATETDYVACVGGCYKSGINTPLYTVGHTNAQGASNSWLTTSTGESSSSRAKKNTGRWYDRMGDDTTNTN